MISNVDIQTAIISLLKSDTALAAWLVSAGSSGDEIRESQWQGGDFSYPAVRVALGTQSNIPEGCYSQTVFLVAVFSEQDSSLEADTGSAIVLDALSDKQLPGLNTSGIIVDSMPHALRTGERLWRATVGARVTTY